jgi:3-hydroxy-9,10-secoandrosta-1,3,5(10)-triene-9,17-dione monooxygenase
MLRPNSGVPDRSEIMRRAAALAPVLRSRAEACEALRRVPDETINDLVTSRIPRMCQPARFGGSELGFDAICEMSIAMAQGDGSQAWVANIYAEHGFLTALFDDVAQHEVWDANPDALVAATVIPQGNRVEKVSDGFRLTGRWGFTSGVHHAHWTVIGEVMRDASGGGQHFFFLVPAADYRIDDDWHAVGMVGTGSTTIELDGVLVPAHRAISGRDVAAGTTPGARVNTAPLYRMPMLGFAQLALAAVPVGIATGMVADFKAHVAAKRSAAARVQGLSQDGVEVLYERLSEAAVETRAAALLILDAARSNMGRLIAGDALGEADAALSLRNGAYAATLAKRAATRLFEAVGGRGIYLAQPMQRAFRDVHASAMHGSLSWERNSVRYGHHLLSADG